MKKILLGTTAVIALATLSTEAFAADKIKLGLGGFMRHYAGVSNHDEVAATALSSTARKVNLQQWSNTEVYFRGATTLDNGLTVSVDIQREADKSTAARNDISSLKIASDAMGALTVGSTTHAGDDFLVRVPQVNGLDWGDTDKFGGVATAAGTASATWAPSSVDITDMGGKAGKLKYVTPTFSGFTGYASYTAAETLDISSVTASVASRNTSHDGSTMGVAYEGELSGVAVSADVTHFRNNGTMNVTHGGLSVGMAGFTVGGGYSDFNDDTSVNTLAATTSNVTNDGNAWELGVGYETGPYSLAVGYMDASSKGTIATVGDNEDRRWNVGAAYDLGAGVALTADYFHNQANPEGTGTTVATGKETTVSGVLAGIEVGF